MKLNELIHEIDFERLWPVFDKMFLSFKNDEDSIIKFHCVLDNNKKAQLKKKYLQVYNNLLDETNIEDNNNILVVLGYLNIDEDDIDYQVGKYDEKMNDFCSIWGISYSKLLGYEILEENIIEYSKEVILAAFLWDITFLGFNQDEVKEELQNLEKRLKESMTIESLSKSIPLKTDNISKKRKQKIREIASKNMDIRNKYLKICSEK